MDKTFGCLRSSGGVAFRALVNGLDNIFATLPKTLRQDIGTKFSFRSGLRRLAQQYSLEVLDVNIVEALVVVTRRRKVALGQSVFNT